MCFQHIVRRSFKPTIITFKSLSHVSHVCFFMVTLFWSFSILTLVTIVLFLKRYCYLFERISFMFTFYVPLKHSRPSIFVITLVTLYFSVSIFSSIPRISYHVLTGIFTVVTITFFSQRYCYLCEKIFFMSPFNVSLKHIS